MPIIGCGKHHCLRLAVKNPLAREAKSTMELLFLYVYGTLHFIKKIQNTETPNNRYCFKLLLERTTRLSIAEFVVITKVVSFSFRRPS